MLTAGPHATCLTALPPLFAPSTLALYLDKLWALAQLSLNQNCPDRQQNACLQTARPASATGSRSLKMSGTPFGIGFWHLGAQATDCPRSVLHGVQVSKANKAVESEIRGSDEGLGDRPGVRSGVHDDLLAQPAVCEQFVALLCQFQPAGVLPFLQSHDSYRSAGKLCC